MASGGRGRGRGILATKIQSLLQKPGEINQANSYEYTLKQIQQLNANSDELQYNEILEKSKNYITSKELLQTVGTAIHERAMKDRNAAKVIAQLCTRMIGLECDNLTFRTILLNSLQQDFKNKDNIRSSSREQFANSIAFLCEIFGCVHLANGEPYKVLIGPISQGMKMLLDNSATLCEVQTCTEQLQNIGPVMNEQCPEIVEEIFLILRSKILDPKTSENKKMMVCLLEALELYCRTWEPLSEKLVQFYQTNHATTASEKIPIEPPRSPVEPPPNYRVEPLPNVGIPLENKMKSPTKYTFQSGSNNRMVRNNMDKHGDNNHELWD